jgi:hypothetical protein
VSASARAAERDERLSEELHLADTNELLSADNESSSPSVVA